jgi:hypothetical protein
MGEIEQHANTCYSCEAATIRSSGEYVTKIEHWTDRRLYCEPCAEAWVRGDYDGDPDE